MSIPRAVAQVEAFYPPLPEPIAPEDEPLQFWRLAHRACVGHLVSCEDCGMELCPDGATLWRAADDAEAALPWSVS